MTLSLSYWIVFLIGLLAGIVAMIIFNRITTKSGYLRIDHSNPKKDIFRLEVDGIADRTTKRFVLKVDHNADLSQD